MKKIIVPTDFSDCAKNALNAASDIARKSGAEIHLIHVYERPVYGFAEANIDIIKNRKTLNQIEKKLNETAAFDFMKNIKLKKHIISDKKIWEMLNSKIFSDADLIVMGSNGSSGWREYFIGSNTEKIVRLADAPVLVIKENHEGFKIENMVFASNFYKEAAAVFLKIKKLALLFGTKIHLLRVNTPAEFETTAESNKSMEEFARKFYLKNYTANIYNDETVEDGINHFSKMMNVDLIAMETHGRTGIAHIITGSITEDLVNHVSIPVLSVKIKQELKQYNVYFPEEKMVA